MFESLRIDPPGERPPGPRRLIVVKWPDGSRTYFTHGMRMFDYFTRSKTPHPIFARGTTTEVFRDDGSAAFAKRHERASREPLTE